MLCRSIRGMGESTMKLSMQQLACFIAVSEHLNFSRAAKQLYLSQSAVSLQM